MRTRTEYIVVHCSATRVEQDIGVEDIRRWHLKKGWTDIGYHYVIRRNGAVERGRNIAVAGSHVKGFNGISVGICLVGGLDGSSQPADNFTPRQKSALRKLVLEMMHMYPGAKLVGHRDLSPDLDGDGVVEKHEWLKDCPCFDVREWLSR